MRPYAQLPIRQKLQFIIAVIAGTVLLAAGAGVILWDQVLYRETVQRDLTAVAEIVANNSTAAVAFNDPDSAAATLASLSAKPHAILGCVYRGDGSLLAQYVRKSAAAACPGSAPSTAQPPPGELAILRPVLLNGQSAGTLLIRYDLGELRERLILFGLTVLGGLALATLLAVLLSGGLRRSITEPILSLAGTARAVSRTRDYGLRAHKFFPDETGALVDGFNEMLEAIQLRDSELRRARDELEQRVLERTAELTRLVDIIEAAQDFIGFADAGDLRIIYINRAGRAMIGLGEKEDLGSLKVSDVHSESTNRLLRDTGLPTAARNGFWQGEGTFLHRDGHEVPVLMALNAHLDEQGDVREYSTISRDITERKHAEAELRLSEERFRLLVERVEEYAIFILDPAGHVSSWNRGAQRLFGWQEGEILGQHFSRFYPAEDKQRGKPNSELAVAGAAGRVEDEGWRVRKDGSRFWVYTVITALRDQESSLIGFSKIMRDLTQRRRTEETLRERAALLDLTHEAIIVRDLNQKITLWNQGAEETYGWSAQEAMGRISYELLQTRFPKPMEEIEEEVLRKGRWEGELLQTSRWGSRIVVDSRWALQRDEHGAPVGILAFSRDVTARRRAENALKRQAEELARSNMDLQQFAYVASHDLQEPLRMVTSYMQLLEDQYKGKLGPDADEFIGFAVDGAMRMRQLITGLLAYSRVGSGGLQLVPVDCSAVMDEVRGNLAVAIRESGAVVSNDPLPTVIADGLQMLQLFQNLVNNALVFHGSEPPRVHVSARPEGALWRFSVADNGIGIAPEYRERIFGIFQRLHDRMQYKGTGIGLAICKKIVERRGGKIWVESEPGKGATFFFTIPVELPEWPTGNAGESVG